MKTFALIFVLVAAGRAAGDVFVRTDGAAGRDSCRVETAVVTNAGEVVSRRTTVCNAGATPVVVREAMDRWTFGPGDWEVYTQSSDWQNESIGRWRPLEDVVETSIEKMRACDGAAPVLAIWDRRTKAGHVFQAISDGEWLLRAVRMKDGVRVEAGYNPKFLKWRLEPGETMALPEVLDYPCQNRTDLDCHRLHVYWNARCPASDVSLSPIYNTWLCRFDKLELDFVLKQVARAKEIGFSYFVVDAGWFGPKANWGCVRGDWEERADGWLGGRLADVSKAVRAAGMKFGFWVEAECAVADSRAVKEHPDWFFKADDQYFLDFRKRAAFDGLLETVCALVKRYEASFLKFDFNQTAHEDATGRVWADYNAAYRRFVEAVRARNPGLYIEGCASGGYMMDLGWSRTFDGFWLSDNQSAYAGVRIVKDTMLRLPPRYMERWLTLAREKGLQPDYWGNASRLVTTEDATWSHYRTLAPSHVDAFAASGPFCMSCNLLTFDGGDIAHFQDLIHKTREDAAFWKTAVGRILVDTPDLTVLQYSDAALTDVRLVVVPNGPDASVTVRPVVDAAVVYVVDGQSRSGADLMHTGIPVSMSKGECRIIRFSLLAGQTRHVDAGAPSGEENVRNRAIREIKLDNCWLNVDCKNNGWDEQTGFKVYIDGREEFCVYEPIAGGAKHVYAFDVSRFRGKTARIVATALGTFENVALKSAAVAAEPAGNAVVITTPVTACRPVMVKLVRKADAKFLYVPLKRDAAPVLCTVWDGAQAAFDLRLRMATDGEGDFCASIPLEGFTADTVQFTTRMPVVPETVDWTKGVSVGATARPGDPALARPKLHFSAPFGGSGDMVGFFRQGDTYHMGYLHDYGYDIWNENCCWSHATSTDFFGWQEASAYDRKGVGMKRSSGCCFVDEKNVSGLGDGKTPPVLLFGCLENQYAQRWQKSRFDSSAGPEKRAELLPRMELKVLKCDGTAEVGRDHGAVRELFRLNAIGGHDPEVVYDAAHDTYVMVVHDRRDGKWGFDFYVSKNLINWEYASTVPGMWETPNFYPLVCDGKTYWVLQQCQLEYLVGTFDGRTFTPEGRINASFMGAFAPRTFETADGRRVLMAARRDAGPTGGATLPMEVRLVKTAEGPRLAYAPVREIAKYTSQVSDTTEKVLGDTWEVAGRKGKFLEGEPRIIRTIVDGPVTDYFVGWGLVAGTMPAQN